MMNRFLAFLLVFQLLLIAVLYWPDGDDPVLRSALLESVDPGALTAVDITDGDGNSIRLQRDGDGWRLPGELPADSGKVATLLDALLARDPGFAIARSDAAAPRFEVAQDRFERKIELLADGDPHTVFLGSSPSFRKVHARVQDDSAVYVLDFNSYDAPATAIGWLDRGLFAMRDLEAMTLNGNTFRLDGDRWLTAAQEPADGEAMDALLTALAGLQVSGINDADNETAAAAAEILRIDTVAADGTRRGLRVLENSEAELYYLRGDDVDGLFNTSAYDAERVRDAVQQLTEPAADDAAPARMEENERETGEGEVSEPSGVAAPG